MPVLMYMYVCIQYVYVYVSIKIMYVNYVCILLCMYITK